MKAPEKRKRYQNCKNHDNMKRSLRHCVLIVSWMTTIGLTFVKYSCYTTHLQFCHKD